MHDFVTKYRPLSFTALCAMAQPWESIIIGAIGSLIVNGSIELLNKLKIDDPVGKYCCIVSYMYSKFSPEMSLFSLKWIYLCSFSWNDNTIPVNLTHVKP